MISRIRDRDELVSSHAIPMKSCWTKTNAMSAGYKVGGLSSKIKASCNFAQLALNSISRAYDKRQSPDQIRTRQSPRSTFGRTSGLYNGRSTKVSLLS